MKGIRFEMAGLPLQRYRGFFAGVINGVVRSGNGPYGADSAGVDLT